MTDVLELGMRRRLYALVQDYPGVHLRAAERELGTSVALVEYHAKVLVEAGLVREEREGHTVQLWATEPKNEPTPQERAWLKVLRLPQPLRVTLLLLDHPEGLRHGEVATALDLGKSKLSFHLRKLEAVGLVAKDGEGRFVVPDRRAAVRALLRFPPTPTLQEEYAELWDAIYGD